MLPTELLSETFPEPTFVEHDDCVFLECQFSQKTYYFWLDFYQKRSKGKGAVEAGINTIHVHELFMGKPSEITASVAKEAARTILEVWRSKLCLDFPNRHFEFKFSAGAPPKASLITFYQTKHKSSSFS
jgi:hypothetical protein